MRGAEEVTFGGPAIDRAAELRRRPERIDALARDARSRCLALWRGKIAIGPEGPAWVPVAHPVFEGAGPAVFLGCEDGAGFFARDISGWVPDSGEPARPGDFFDPTEQVHPALPEGVRLAELRGHMATLSARDAGLAATARALTGWHRSHGFCAACGSPTAFADAGWSRRCPACGAQHFPRTDPVVIMLVLSGNSVLLGRSPGWPDGMYSLLAGFMEPGETVEAAVRREVREEAGVPVGPVRYLASQPWPFPSSLMIGVRGEALATSITLDPVELEDALWLTREEVAAAFRGAHPVVRPPRRGAIAGFLLANWLADRLD